jgi:hypothetical protein
MNFFKTFPLYKQQLSCFGVVIMPNAGIISVIMLKTKTLLKYSCYAYTEWPKKCIHTLKYKKKSKECIHFLGPICSCELLFEKSQ